MRSVEGFSSFRQSSVECLAVMGLQTALNLIVIQHQSFNVSVMYSHSLRVPLMAGPLCLAFFSSDAGLYVMPMFDKLGLRL